MNKTMAAALLAALAGPGCTTEQVYNSAQGWRRNECNRIADEMQRARCMKEADRSYGTYKREADAGGKP